MESLQVYDLPQEMISRITNQLCIVDRMALKFTCWDHYETYIDLDIVPFIKARIKDFVDIEFLEFINEEVIISGSFLVACLYDTYDYDDIDIYEMRSTVNDLVKRALKLPENEREYFYDSAPMEDYLEFMDEYIPDGYDSTYIKKNSKLTKFLFLSNPTEFRHVDPETDEQSWSVMNFEFEDINGRSQNFQRILIRESARAAIFFDYDLDLCRNYFDGKLHVSSWSTLMSRTSLMMPNSHVALAYARKGFYQNVLQMRENYYSIIKNINEYLDFQTKRSVNRYKKYVGRGFNIIPVDDFEQKLLDNTIQYLNDINVTIDEKITLRSRNYVNIEDIISEINDVEISFEFDTSDDSSGPEFY